MLAFLLGLLLGPFFFHGLGRLLFGFLLLVHAFAHRFPSFFEVMTLSKTQRIAQRISHRYVVKLDLLCSKVKFFGPPSADALYKGISIPFSYGLPKLHWNLTCNQKKVLAEAVQDGNPF